MGLSKPLFGRGAAAALWVAGASLLAGCGGGGGSMNSGPTNPGGNPSIIDPATDGPSVATTLASGAQVSAAASSGTRLVYDAAKNTTTAGRASMTMQRNVIGGYDVTLNGRLSSFGYADQKSSGDAWEKIVRNPQGNPVYSLTLWNAGKGGRDGLTTNQNGQTFHKIIGYYAFDNTGTAAVRDRGHFIVGDDTDLLRMAAKTKTATYDGYFYSNIMPVAGTPPDQALAASGGMRFVADFDRDVISGQSTTFTVREAGAPNFNPQSYTVWMQPTAITGNTFTGRMDSNYIWMNGTYAGQFFGGNANEVAGVMTGVAGAGVNEGFFTAVQQ